MLCIQNTDKEKEGNCGANHDERKPGAAMITMESDIERTSLAAARLATCAIGISPEYRSVMAADPLLARLIPASSHLGLQPRRNGANQPSVDLETSKLDEDPVWRFGITTNNQ